MKQPENALQQFLEQLRETPTSINFNDTMAIIEKLYTYTPSDFKNGPDVTNDAGTNEGSCKLFAFAKLQNLSQQQTLQCFGDYYRKDVLENPDNTDHANIRSFIQNGRDGISFTSTVLTPR